MNRDKVTGQILFRDAAEEAPTKDGRRLVSFVGIVAVPEDFKFKGEHQYVLCGPGSGKSLTLFLETEVDQTKLTIGQDTGNILTEPIWRC